MASYSTAAIPSRGSCVSQRCGRELGHFRLPIERCVAARLVGELLRPDTSSGFRSPTCTACASLMRAAGVPHELIGDALHHSSEPSSSGSASGRPSAR